MKYGRDNLPRCRVLYKRQQHNNFFNEISRKMVFVVDDYTRICLPITVGLRASWTIHCDGVTKYHCVGIYSDFTHFLSSSHKTLYLIEICGGPIKCWRIVERPQWSNCENACEFRQENSSKYTTKCETKIISIGLFVAWAGKMTCANFGLDLFDGFDSGVKVRWLPF
jgi:hypothetical protein